MSTVYKYPFQVDDDVRIDMPIGAEILLIETQNGVPTIWAQVNPKATYVTRRFRVVGTGHPFESDRVKHVGSFQQPPFVWHLYEVI